MTRNKSWMPGKLFTMNKFSVNFRKNRKCTVIRCADECMLPNMKAAIIVDNKTVQSRVHVLDRSPGELNQEKTQ